MSIVPARDLATGIVAHAPDRGDARHSPRPWLHPITTPAGVVVTEDQPADHPWHRGLSLAVSHLTEGRHPPQNFWGGPTYCDGDYVQLDNNGSQHLVERRVDGGVAREELQWRAAGGRPLLSESRTVAVSATTAYVRIDWQSTLTSQSAESLGFGSPTTAGRPNAGYGGLFLRGSPSLLGADVMLDGVMTSAAAAMGVTARWAALRSPTLTVAIVADSANPVSPSPWFVRVDPVVMLCAAPFFHDEWRLAPNATATWRWSVLAIDGAASADELAALVS